MYDLKDSMPHTTLPHSTYPYPPHVPSPQSPTRSLTPNPLSRTLTPAAAGSVVSVLMSNTEYTDEDEVEVVKLW